MRQSTRRGRKGSLLLRGNDAQHLVRTVGGTNPTGKLGNRKKARNLRQHLDVLGGILGIRKDRDDNVHGLAIQRVVVNAILRNAR